MSKENDPVPALVNTARRQQILEAAIQVFAEKGFHRATIKEIARAADLADGTIYNYFENKTDLLLQIMNHLNQSENRPAHFEAGRGQDFQTFLASYMRQRLSFMDSSTNMLRAVLPELLVNSELRTLYSTQILEPTMQIAVNALKEREADGQVRKTDTQLTVRLLSGMALGVMMLQLLDDKVVEDRWNDLADAATRMFYDGLKPI